MLHTHEIVERAGIIYENVTCNEIVERAGIWKYGSSKHYTIFEFFVSLGILKKKTNFSLQDKIWLWVKKIQFDSFQYGKVY